MNQVMTHARSATRTATAGVAALAVSLPALIRRRIGTEMQPLEAGDGPLDAEGWRGGWATQRV